MIFVSPKYLKMLAEIAVDLRSLRAEIGETEDVKKLYRFVILFM
jgi:hypothetical protein